MQTKDLLLILSVIVTWGLNFTAIRIGLDYAPPFLLGALRFIPFLFIFFLFKRPQIPWYILITYGLVFCFAQFALLFLGIALGMPAGMSSMVLQSQAFFTVLLARFTLSEPFKIRSLIGLCISALGLTIICAQADASLTLIGLLLTLSGGACWGIGNILMKKYANANMLDLTIWAGLVPILPFLACSLLLEGPQAIMQTVELADMKFVLAILYIAILSTIYGNSIWGKMMRKYAVSYVAPFSLLVPVVGISSAAYFLQEYLTLTDIIGALTVMIGLSINVFGGKVFDMIKILTDKKNK